MTGQPHDRAPGRQHVHGGGAGLRVSRRSVGERPRGAGRGRDPQVTLPLRQRVLIDQVSRHAAAGGEPRRSGAGDVEPVDIGLLPGSAAGRAGGASGGHAGARARRRLGQPPFVAGYVEAGVRAVDGIAVGDDADAVAGTERV